MHSKYLEVSTSNSLLNILIKKWFSISNGSSADKTALKAYTNGEASDQIAQPRVGSRSSLVLYV